MIRDGITSSERVHKVSISARWLYVTILLHADDIGLFEANHFRLGREAGLDQSNLQPLLDELTAQDLIRPYKVGAKGYGFVPRYRQRLRVKRAKHPLPPDGLMVDDDDAVNKIKGLHVNPRTDDGEPLTNARHARPEPEPEPEEEIKRPRSVGKQRTTAPKAPIESIVALYHEVLPELPAVRLMPAKRKAALQKVWAWVLTSSIEGRRRAENDEQGLAWMRKYFERARENDFLMGRGKRSDEHANWRCDIDFLMTDKGMKHVIEKTE